MATLEQKKKALEWYQRSFDGGPTQDERVRHSIVVELLTKDIRSAEAEERSRLPTLSEVETELRASARVQVEQGYRESDYIIRCRLVAAEIIKVIRETKPDGPGVRVNWINADKIAQHARLE